MTADVIDIRTGAGRLPGAGYDCEPFDDGRGGHDHRRRCRLCGARELDGRFDALGDAAFWLAADVCSPCIVDGALTVSADLQREGLAPRPLFQLVALGRRICGPPDGDGRGGAP